jgi:hypothetical protein
MRNAGKRYAASSDRLMPSATLNLRVGPRRMLSKRESSDYAGLTVKQFEAQCPVLPVEYPNGVKAWDMRDLDNWIDSLKAGGRDDDATDAILSRLD